MGREAAKIDALQQVVSQFETLSPEYQAKLTVEVRDLLTKYQGYQADQARVAQMSKDEFAAFLAERQVSKPYLAPGYRGIYYTIEEFDEALEALTDPEEWAEYQREKAARNANLIYQEVAMIDALQQIMNQLETFPPEEQAELAQTFQRLIDERTGYTTVYGPHTDEEFEALLDSLEAATSHEEYEAIWEKQPHRRVKREEVTNADA